MNFRRVGCIGAGVLLATMATGGVVRAQDTSAATGDPAETQVAPDENQVIVRLAGGQFTGKDIAARLSRTTGIHIVTDSATSVATADLGPLNGPLRTVLETIAARMPKGTVVRRVLLPYAVATNAEGDAVAALINALEGLKPKVPGAKATTVADAALPTMSAGQVDVLNQPLRGARANTVVNALGLRPVYLIARPIVGNDPVAKMASAQAGALNIWMRMSKEQRQAAGEQQIDAILNMDPAARRALFAQQAELAQGFIQKIQALPEQQRVQFWLDLTDGKWDGRNLPKQPAGQTPAKPGEQ